MQRGAEVCNFLLLYMYDIIPIFTSNFNGSQIKIAELNK